LPEAGRDNSDGPASGRDSLKRGGDMIEKRSKADVPRIQQPIRQRRPESAFARRQVAEFLASGLDLAEITKIPTAYNTTRLYGALGNAIWRLCDRPRSVRPIRRGGPPVPAPTPFRASSPAAGGSVCPPAACSGCWRKRRAASPEWCCACRIRRMNWRLR